MSSTVALDRVLSQIDDWIDPSGVTGAGVVVRANGAEIGERYAGEAQPGIEVDRSTLFGLASVTKPITAAVVMTLVDDGKDGEPKR